MTNTTTNEATAIISATSSWHPGHGTLATLRSLPDDVGYSRQKVGGSIEDFRVAIAATVEFRETLTGGDKASATAVIKNLRAGLSRAERDAERKVAPAKVEALGIEAKRDEGSTIYRGAVAYDDGAARVFVIWTPGHVMVNFQRVRGGLVVLDVNGHGKDIAAAEAEVFERLGVDEDARTWLADAVAAQWVTPLPEPNLDAIADGEDFYRLERDGVLVGRIVITRWNGGRHAAFVGNSQRTFDPMFYGDLMSETLAAAVRWASDVLDVPEEARRPGWTPSWVTSKGIA